MYNKIVAEVAKHGEGNLSNPLVYTPTLWEDLSGYITSSECWNVHVFFSVN
jgi:hypothetical protein